MKKPSKGVLEDPQVAGQIYNYMLRLRSFHGLKNVFSILTTYEEWRICWFAEANESALSDNVRSSIHEEKQKVLDPEPTLEELEQVEDIEQEEFEIEPDKRYYH